MSNSQICSNDWEQDAIREAVAVVENWGDYVELPDKEEVNDYLIMEDFCYSQEDNKLRDKLCDAIDGKGAFRRFKEPISRHGIENDVMLINMSHYAKSSGNGANSMKFSISNSSVPFDH
ncbi:MAG: UPF0158 family protein [Desulfosporosinus sp.]|nr:UPF0158 family protein [Desulfosporosinus sp.]